MNRSFPLSIALATALGVSSLAFAATSPQASAPPAAASSGSMQQGKWHGMHHRHRHHGDMRMLDKLNLSDAQRNSIRQMTRESFEQARPEMQALRQKREALEAATPGSSAYQTATNELATAEANAARERVGREAALRTRIYGVLSPEQRTRLASLRAAREAKMQQWRSEHRRHSSGAPAPAASSG